MRRQVAVLLAGLDDAHGSVVAGLKRYRDQHNLAWDVRIVSPEQIGTVPAGTCWVLRTAGPVQQVLEQARDPVLPVCTLLGSESGANRTCTTFVEDSFGALAAQHLHERGYRHAFTVDIGVRERFDRRRAGFRQACQRLGIVYEHYVRVRGGSAADGDAHLSTWIRSRPGPLAFYGVIDSQATWLRDMVLERGLRVPEELAILGTGGHTATCISREPEIASVAYPWGLMGEVAGHHLHHQLQGAGPPAPQHLRAYQVVARASCPPRSASDPMVARAVAWLGQHLGEARPLAALVDLLGLSDPTICRRFKADLGISPKQVHDHLRIDRAVELLADPHLSVAEVARRSGFSSSTALGVAFKRRRGCSPGQWRAAQG